MPRSIACPACHGSETKRVHRSGAADRLISLLGWYPHSCRECRNRFRAFIKPANFVRCLVLLLVVTAAALGVHNIWSKREPAKDSRPLVAESGARVPGDQGGSAQQSLAQLQQENSNLRRRNQSLTALAAQAAVLQQRLDEMDKRLQAAERAASETPPAKQAKTMPARPARTDSQMQQEVEHLKKVLAIYRKNKLILENQVKALKKELLGLRQDASPGRAALPGMPAASLSFASGRASLSPKAEASLRKLIPRLKSDNSSLYLVGQADSTPMGAKTAAKFGDNQGLALARALSVFRYLQDAGVPAERMNIQIKGGGQRAGQGRDARLVRLYIQKKPPRPSGREG